MLHTPDLLASLNELLISHWPGPHGIVLRHHYWSSRLKRLGDGAIIETGVHFQNPQLISIGSQAWIDKNVMILAGHDESTREKTVVAREPRVAAGEVHIGDHVHLAPQCIVSGISSGVHLSDYCSVAAGSRLYAFSHHYRSMKNPANTAIYFAPRVPFEQQALVEGPIYLGPNTGVAAGCTLLPGVVIERESFVGLHSVVRAGRYPENSLLAGNPAVRVGARFGAARERRP